MGTFKDLKHQRFNNVVVLERDFTRLPGRNGAVYWKCYDIKKDKVRVMRSDFIQRTRTYKAWDNVLQRCDRASTKNFECWGGRGIKIEDPRWRKFANFLADLGECPDGLTLERLDNERGYYKENCVWDTWTAQAANRRKRRTG